MRRRRRSSTAPSHIDCRGRRAATPAAQASQSKRSAKSRAAPPSPRGARSRRARAPPPRTRRRRRDQQAAAAGRRAPPPSRSRRCDHRHAARLRLGDHQPEALERRAEQQHVGAVVQAPLVGVGHAAQEAHVRTARFELRPGPRRRRRARRRRRPAQRRDVRAVGPLARLQPADVQHPQPGPGHASGQPSVAGGRSTPSVTTCDVLGGTPRGDERVARVRGHCDHRRRPARDRAPPASAQRGSRW